MRGQTFHTDYLVWLKGRKGLPPALRVMVEAELELAWSEQDHR